MRPYKAFGIEIEESEVIYSNSQFMIDGSDLFRNYENSLSILDEAFYLLAAL